VTKAPVGLSAKQQPDAALEATCCRDNGAVTGAEGTRNNAHPDFDLVLHKPLEPDFVEMVKELIYHSKD